MTRIPVKEIKEKKNDPNKCVPGRKHEFRIVSGFCGELSRTSRLYGAYCIHCLKTRKVEVNI